MPSIFSISVAISIILLSILGLFTYVQNKKSEINLSLVYLLSLVIIWVLTIYGAYSFHSIQERDIGTKFIQLSYVIEIFITYLICRFFYFFPKKSRKISRNFLNLIYVLTIVSGILSAILFSDIIANLETEVLKVSTVVLEYFYYSQIIINFILSLFLAIDQIKNQVGLTKKVCISLSFVMLVFLASILDAHIILPIVNINLFQHYIVFASYFLFIGIYYVIYKYDFLNLKSSRYEIIRQCIMIAGFILTSYSLFATRENEINFYVYLFSTSTGLITYLIIGKYLKKKESINLISYQEAYREIKSKIHIYDSYKKYQSLLENIFILKLGFSSIKIHTPRNKKTRKIIPILSSEAILKAISQLQSFQNISINPSSQKHIFDHITRKDLKDIQNFQEVNNSDYRYMMPLYFEEEMIAVICLGENKSVIDAEEIKILLDIRKEIELSFSNLLIKENLQEENNLMRQVIAKKTKNLKEQITKTKDLLKQQSDFIALAAHEFRTPLSIALFQAEESIDNIKNKQSASEVKKISDSLINLKLLTDKLFAVQQFDLKKVNLDMQTFNLAETISETTLEMQKILDSKNASVILDIKDIKCRFDKFYLKQVFTNIIQNSIKFNNTEAQIKIKLSKKPKSIVIEFHDNGPGFEHPSLALEKFKGEKHQKGIGLGLYICKKIIDLHEGKIQIDNKGELGGARVKITLNY